MEKLTLEHLAPYLPYGLKMYAGELAGVPLIYPMMGLFEFINGIVINTLTNGEDLSDGVNTMNIKQHNFKPILRPLSDLAKEIEVNSEKFVPYDLHTDTNYIGNTFMCKLNKCRLGILHSNFLPYYVTERLISWHFNVFGLIEKGLAIDINTLK